MNRVKELRLKAGMQQKELAIALNVQQPSVSRWEQQKADPTDENVDKLAAIFGVTPNDIIYYRDPNIPRWDIQHSVVIPSPNDTNASAPRTPEARIVSFGMDNLPKENRERLLNIILAMYAGTPEEKYFKEGNDDER